MAEENDPKTFDLIAALEGRTYPHETVPIFLDEGLMYEYAKAAKESDQDPANKAKKKAVKDLREKFKGAALMVKVQGIPPHIRKSIRDTANKEHPIKFNNFSQAIPNPEFAGLYDDLIWENMVVQITPPDGEAFHPTPADIKAIRGMAPDPAVDALVTAIDGLSEGAKSGYEQIVQEPGFLSQP